MTTTAERFERVELDQPAAEARERFESMTERLPLEEYNFDRFRTRHLAYDAQATIRTCGIHPGQMAPDFELPLVGGGTLRLSALRGRPVLLHFGSFT